LQRDIRKEIIKSTMDLEALKKQFELVDDKYKEWEKRMKVKNKVDDVLKKDRIEETKEDIQKELEKSEKPRSQRILGTAPKLATTKRKLELDPLINERYNLSHNLNGLIGIVKLINGSLKELNSGVKQDKLRTVFLDNLIKVAKNLSEYKKVLPVRENVKNADKNLINGHNSYVKYYEKLFKGLKKITLFLLNTAQLMIGEGKGVDLLEENNNKLIPQINELIKSHGRFTDITTYYYIENKISVFNDLMINLKAVCKEYNKIFSTNLSKRFSVMRFLFKPKVMKGRFKRLLNDKKQINKINTILDENEKILNKNDMDIKEIGDLLKQQARGAGLNLVDIKAKNLSEINDMILELKQVHDKFKARI